MGRQIDPPESRDLGDRVVAGKDRGDDRGVGPADRETSSSEGLDPLDQLSGVSLIEGGPEMTFRELAAHCAKDFRLLDSLEPRDRYAVQRHNDPNWKPIQPYEGLRKRPRKRGV